MILWALCTLHLWRYYGHGYLGIVWGLLRYEDMSMTFSHMFWEVC